MPQRPNIILIMTDQQQARACGREGFPWDITPHQDTMAHEGVWFDKAYTPIPLCGPARVSLFTGRRPTSTGIRCNRITQPRYQKDLFDVLKAANYKTAMIGKNHTHLEEKDCDFWYQHDHQGAHTDKGIAGAERNSMEVDFDAWLGSLHHWISNKPTPFPLHCQSPARLIKTAKKWISKNRNTEPFFMHLSINEPHNPYQVPEPYFSMFRNEKLPPVIGDKTKYKEKGFKWEVTGKIQRKAKEDFDQKFEDYRYNYYSMCRLIDDQIKSLEEHLSNEGILENTILFFISDHGDFVGDYGLMRKGPGLPETLCRVPFIVKGAGIQSRKKVHDAHVNLIDIFPTICEIIGQDIPEGVQGKSLAPLLRGEEYPKQDFDTAFCETGYGGLNYNWEDQPDLDKYISPKGVSFNELNEYSLGGSMRMVRFNNWKLISEISGKQELYDLKEDPGELYNRIDSKDPAHLKIKAELMEKMILMLIQNEEPLSNVSKSSYPDKLKTHPRNFKSDH